MFKNNLLTYHAWTIWAYLSLFAADTRVDHETTHMQ